MHNCAHILDKLLLLSPSLSL